MGSLLYCFFHMLVPLVILSGATLLYASLLVTHKIIHELDKSSHRLFWEIIAIIVAFFFISYLFIAYLIYWEPLSSFIVLTTIMCFVGAYFVYIILSNSLKTIREIFLINTQLADDIRAQNNTLESLNKKSEAVATATARMAQMYTDLEEAKLELEEKESTLQRKNDELSKVNSALANANANISNLFIELEETKEELLENKEELIKKNQMLSETNVLLSDVFKKFVPEQFLYKIAKEGIENICAGYAERIDLTVVFSDIRSFTNMSEKRNPTDILTILNIYFKHMSEKIYANNGFIDKFIGDAIMSLFESDNTKPIEQTSHANNAVNAAIGMQLVLDIINEKTKDLTDMPLKTGIGINTGDALIGTIGFEDRMESTVLGSTVNIASRIEALTKSYGAGVIVSKSTINSMRDLYKYQYRSLGLTSIRGIENKIELFEFFDGDAEEIRVLKYKTIPYFSEAAHHSITSNWDKAINEYKNALKIFPNDIAAKYLLALAENSNQQS